jgi:protein-tyrosine phosphatase
MNFSEITPYLYIGTTPSMRDYDQLRELDVRLIINMRWNFPPWPDLHHPPIKRLWLPVVDSPFLPIPIKALWKGVSVAQIVLEQGGKVYSHCTAGAHRGVAMGAVILISQDYSPEDAMRLIRQQREKADPYIWYIRRQILRFGEQWLKNKEAVTGLASKDTA